VTRHLILLLTMLSLLTACGGGSNSVSDPTIGTLRIESVTTPVQGGASGTVTVSLSAPKGGPGTGTVAITSADSGLLSFTPTSQPLNSNGFATFTFTTKTVSVDTRVEFKVAVSTLSLINSVTITAGSTSTAAQKAWVRAHLDDVYLWFNEIVDVPPANYATAPDYFDALLVRSRDRFSFSMPLSQATGIFQEGVETGYGVKWGWGTGSRLFAYYVDPAGPAFGKISRGTEITAINGKALALVTDAELYSALFPDRAGVVVTLAIRPPATILSLQRPLTSATFPTTTVEPPRVLTLANGAKVGYLLFNDHLLSAEAGLRSALTTFQQQGITDLVLDLRYNGGGYLFIAQELASMIGGAAVQGKVFERLLFNSKHPEMTNDPQSTYLFSNQDISGAALPLLGLSRVFVLTGSSTCSASESIINGLLPHIQVVRVGATTCGKPYGFIQANNGLQAYFAIRFEGVNANGTDDFKTGFAPTCPVFDDLRYPLGDSREARLDAALYFVGNNACPPTPTPTLPKTAADALPMSGDPRLVGQRPGLKLTR